MSFEYIEKQITSGADIQIPDTLKQWLSEPKAQFIGGKWIKSSKTFTTVNPATGEVLAQIMEASADQVAAAVGAARQSFKSGAWANCSLADRATTLHHIADLIDEHRAHLAILESLDTGKPIRESYEGDIVRSASNFRFFADYAQQLEPLRFEKDGDLHLASREPAGVVALITPWNLPLYLESWKIAPALMMGNSIVLKPSELTPLTASYLAYLIEQSNLPAGVFNLIHGFGENSAGEQLVASRGVDAISFTGETTTGSAIMRSAAVGPTKVSFELGGKGSSILFEDADIDEAVQTTVRAAFRNQGEICLASPRVFVHESIYEKVLGAFTNLARDIEVGNPLNYNTTMGALISEGHYNKVTGYLKGLDAKAIHLGGKRPAAHSQGNYLEPTILTGLTDDHPISCEEVFGPVVSFYSFAEESEVVERVNNTPYGLSGSVWSADVERAKRVSDQLNLGLVWINCWFVRDLRVPFGGQKRSGVGREGGTFSLDFFSQWKSVCVRGGASDN